MARTLWFEKIQAVYACRMHVFHNKIGVADGTFNSTTIRRQ